MVTDACQFLISETVVITDLHQASLDHFALLGIRDFGQSFSEELRLLLREGLDLLLALSFLSLLHLLHLLQLGVVLRLGLVVLQLSLHVSNRIRVE